jgi:hypothetical protein
MVCWYFFSEARPGKFTVSTSFAGKDPNQRSLSTNNKGGGETATTVAWHLQILPLSFFYHAF